MIFQILQGCCFLKKSRNTGRGMAQLSPPVIQQLKTFDLQCLEVYVYQDSAFEVMGKYLDNFGILLSEWDIKDQAFLAK